MESAPTSNVVSSNKNLYSALSMFGCMQTSREITKYHLALSNLVLDYPLILDWYYHPSRVE